MAPDPAAAAPARCVHEAFEEQAERTPAATALIYGAQRLSYAELDARASELAGRLVDEGASRGTVIGIYLERGTDMVVAILATLKAGAGYLMLDPGFPEPRLSAMARDAAAAIVVSRDGSAPVSARVVRVTDQGRTPLPRSPGRVSPDDVACVMFTSGSTGRPKGVASPHRAITGSVLGQHFLPFGPDLIWLQCAAVSWDVFALELWGPLLHGGTCVLHPGQRADPLVIARLVAEHRINTAFLSSSLFAVIVDEYPEALDGLRDLVIGGEAPSPPHVARAIARFPRLRPLNGYGPVENMIVITTHPITADAAAGQIPIGKPLAGKRTYVLDARLRPVADGQTGELYGAGEGLAHGYLGRPGFTAERFVACPFGAPGDRMYRTGDLVRWHASGLMEFAGRLDGQVKIRGFRVETAEVELALARHPAVARVAVMVGEDHQGEKQLVAYVVPRTGQSGDSITGTLRSYLSASVPDFMVPSAFVVMSTFPLTQNGKLDRAALPPPRPRAAPADREPRDQDEKDLRELFAEVLGRTPSGIDESFFALGGNSLQAARLLSRIRARLGAEMGIRAVFESPTVAALASRLGDPATRRPPVPRPPPALPDSVPLSFAQRRLWLLDQIDAGVAYVLPVQITLHGELDQDALQAALTDVVARHEALHTVFSVVDGEPVQRVLDGATVRPPFSRVLADPTRFDFEAAVAQASGHRFDLSTEPPVNALLLTDERDRGHHVLLLVLHHIAADDWSLAPLMRDLSHAYAARARGTEPWWDRLPIQYSGYAIRQLERLGDRADPDSRLASQLRYWASAAAGVGDALAPLRNPGVAPGSDASTTARELDAKAHASLDRLATEHGVTLFMLLQAALAVVLHLAGAGDDIAVGGLVAGRDEPDLEDLVGFFVNMVVLRTDLSGDPSTGELLPRVKESALSALAHQDVPFDLVVQEINPERLPGRNPLTDVALALRNNTPAHLSLSGADSQITVLRPGAARFGVLVDVADRYASDGTPDGLTLTVEYRTDEFERDVMDWLASSLTQVLDGMTGDPAAPAASLAQALPAGIRPASGEQPEPASYEAPRTALEHRLADIWADVLGVDRVGLHDNFFSLGGNSLRAVRVAARIVTSEDLPAGADQLFTAPTIARLADVLARAEAGSAPAIPRAPRISRAPADGTR